MGALVGCHAATLGANKMRWENDYNTALTNSSFVGDEEARQAIRLSRSYWKSHPAYRQLHKLVRTDISEQLRSSIRLEVGNANEESYLGIWFVEEAGQVRLCSNYAGPVDVVTCRDVTRILYDQLWDQLEQSQVWLLQSDGSRVHSVLDGTTFFVSIYRNDRSHQFVTYAPDLTTGTTDHHGRIIKSILAFTKG